MNNDTEKETDKEKRLVEEAILELEKSFGSGSKRKSKIVSRGFSLNELVKDED